MAIGSIDNIVAGMQFSRPISKALSGTLVAGRPFSFWPIAGAPGAGSYNTTLAGVALNSTGGQVDGQINFINPPGGQNCHLARLAATCTQAALVILADRLWHDGGIAITSTAAQTINSPTLPARDNTGTSNGDGVLCMLETSAVVGSASPTLTLSYTNQDGVTGRTATNLIGTGSTSQIGPSWMFELQSSDTGIRSIQSYTQSASWISGTVHLVLYRPLAFLETKLAFHTATVDLLSSGRVELFAGTVPYFIFIPSISGGTGIQGSLQYTFG